MPVVRTYLASVLFLAAFAPFAAPLVGQDPVWLRHWEEAQKTRPAELGPEARIASEAEPGTPFVIEGLLLDPDGNPLGGAVVHAYHRDVQGFDFGEGDRTTATWRLQGFARTSVRGEFRFTTIRPGPDHLGREAAHVHLTVESEDFGRQWAPTVYLADDPLITDEQRRRSAARGELGAVREVVEKDGAQSIFVKIRLRREADF